MILGTSWRTYSVTCFHADHDHLHGEVPGPSICVLAQNGQDPCKALLAWKWWTERICVALVHVISAQLGLLDIQLAPMLGFVLLH